MTGLSLGRLGCVSGAREEVSWLVCMSVYMCVCVCVFRDYAAAQVFLARIDV